LVEFLQRAVRRVNAPPNGWVNALQGHFDLKDRGSLPGGPVTRNVGRDNLAPEQARHLLHDAQHLLLLVSLGPIDRCFKPVEKLVQFIEGELHGASFSALGRQRLCKMSGQFCVFQDGAALRLGESQVESLVRQTLLLVRFLCSLVGSCYWPYPSARLGDAQAYCPASDGRKGRGRSRPRRTAERT